MPADVTLIESFINRNACAKEIYICRPSVNFV
jgi:hypothetical protein